MRLNLNRIRSAASIIEPAFLNTPQYECGPLSSALGCRLTLKVETINPLRCFKGRGTDLALSKLGPDFPNERSVVCASAGNLGQALAYSGCARNIQTTVVASAKASQFKLDRIRQLGADVQTVDGDIELAKSVAQGISTVTGAVYLEDSVSIETCEGAGTIALELIDHCPPLDMVLVALGGGALATGIGLVFQTLSPSTDVICIQPESAPAMTLSWRAKNVVETDSCDTIADGVAGRYPSQEVLDDLVEVADDCLLVREESIVRGMQKLYAHAGLVAEPSAALGIAALMENPERFRKKRVATIICGSNISESDFRDMVLC